MLPHLLFTKRILPQSSPFHGSEAYTMLYNICMMQVLDIYSFQPCSFFFFTPHCCFKKVSIFFPFHQHRDFGTSAGLYLTIKKNWGGQVFLVVIQLLNQGSRASELGFWGGIRTWGGEDKEKRQINCSTFQQEKFNNAIIPFALFQQQNQLSLLRR